MSSKHDGQFNLKGFTPAGDQPKAIAQLVDGLTKGMHSQTLLGATGTGKTFTIANVIQQIQKPTLVIAHNKTLAAQLAQELEHFSQTLQCIILFLIMTTINRKHTYQ